MADSVVVLERRELRVLRQQPRFQFRVLALYDLTTGPGLRVRDAIGAVVVVSPSSALPAEYRALLSGPEIAAFDAGAGAWEFREVDQNPGETLADVAARVRALLPVAKAAWIAREQSRYAQFGLRINP